MPLAIPITEMRDGIPVLSLSNEMPEDMLRFQLLKYYEWLITGLIDGVIFCSNNVVDVGLNSVKIVKGWISEHKDEIIE